MGTWIRICYNCKFAISVFVIVKFCCIRIFTTTPPNFLNSGIIEETQQNVGGQKGNISLNQKKHCSTYCAPVNLYTEIYTFFTTNPVMFLKLDILWLLHQCWIFTMLSVDSPLSWANRTDFTLASGTCPVLEVVCSWCLPT